MVGKTRRVSSVIRDIFKEALRVYGTKDQSGALKKGILMTFGALRAP